MTTVDQGSEVCLGCWLCFIFQGRSISSRSQESSKRANLVPLQAGLKQGVGRPECPMAIWKQQFRPIAVPNQGMDPVTLITHDLNWRLHQPFLSEDATAMLLEPTA